MAGNCNFIFDLIFINIFEIKTMRKYSLIKLAYNDEILSNIFKIFIITIGKWEACRQYNLILRIFAVSLRKCEEFSNIFWLDNL